MSFAQGTPEIAAKTFLARVRAKWPESTEPITDEIVDAAIKAGNLKDSNAPHDARFPNVSQSSHCWTKYNEYVLCMKKSGDEGACNSFRRHYSTICPAEWVETFETHREEGVFMGIRD